MSKKFAIKDILDYIDCSNMIKVLTSINVALVTMQGKVVLTGGASEKDRPPRGYTNLVNLVFRLYY